MEGIECVNENTSLIEQRHYPERRYDKRINSNKSNIGTTVYPTERYPANYFFEFAGVIIRLVHLIRNKMPVVRIKMKKRTEFVVISDTRSEPLCPPV